MIGALSDCCSMDRRRDEHGLGVGRDTARNLKSLLWKKKSRALIWKKHAQTKSRECGVGRALNEDGAQASHFTDGEAETQN